MSREADFRQLEGFFRNFHDAYADFPDFLRQFLLEQGLRAIAKAKQKTPEDTGALRNSWALGDQSIQVGRTNVQVPSAFEQAATLESVEVVGDGLEITLYNAMDYASFVEYGHRITNGAWRDGYFMMTLAVDEVSRQIPARFNKAFAEYMKSKGVG